MFSKSLKKGNGREESQERLVYMTGLQNRVFLHWQGNGIKHGLKPLSSEEREERKK